MRTSGLSPSSRLRSDPTVNVPTDRHGAPPGLGGREQRRGDPGERDSLQGAGFVSSEHEPGSGAAGHTRQPHVRGSPTPHVSRGGRPFSFHGRLSLWCGGCALRRGPTRFLFLLWLQFAVLPLPPPKKKPRCRDRDRHREELPLRSPRESRGLRLPSRLLARCAFAFRRGTGQLSRAVLSQVCAQVCAQVIAQVCAQVSAQVCAQVSQLRFPGDCPPFPRVLCFQGCCRDERGNL